MKDSGITALVRAYYEAVDLVRDLEALVLVGDEITHADSMQEGARATGEPEITARLRAMRDVLRARGGAE